MRSGLVRAAAWGLTLALLCAPAGCSNSSSGTGSANVRVVKTYLITDPLDFGGGNVQIVTVVTNGGNAPAELGSSNSWTLHDKNDNVLDTGEFTAITPYLAAGETGYLGAFTRVANDGTFKSIDRADPSLAWSTVSAIPAQKLTTGVVRVGPDAMALWLMATGTVTNTGTTTVTAGQICIILLDAQGEPVGWLADLTTLNGLAPKQAKDFKTSYPWPGASISTRVASYRVYAADLSSR